MSRDGFRKNWFKNWFGKEYTEVYAHRDEQDALDLVQLILKHVPLSKKSKILDAGCGNGRHACALAEYSECVFGIDLSLFLLKQARENCHFKIVQGDIRALPFKQTFDALLSLFTSFGYFFSDEENFAVLKQFRQVLKPDGWFFFDFLNARYVRKHLTEKSVRSLPGKKIIEQRTIIGKRVEKTITIVQGNTVQNFFESVRLYDQQELLSMVRKAGFDILKVMGNYQGQSFHRSSPRLILLAKKR